MESIVCNGIGKIYGKKQVLKDINLTLEKGKIYGLIGRNGAGKTTLLSIMSAQNPASEGTVTWNGENVWENRKALDHICFSRELSINLYGSGVSGMKVKDYLKTASYLSKQASKAWADGLKSTCFTKAQDSRAPCSRSIPLSSHSTESGP